MERTAAVQDLQMELADARSDYETLFSQWESTAELVDKVLRFVICGGMSLMLLASFFVTLIRRNCS